MLLRDLKPLIPELKATRLKMKVVRKEGDTSKAAESQNQLQSKTTGKALPSQESEVVNTDPAACTKCRSLLGEVLTRSCSPKTTRFLKKTSAVAVTADVMHGNGLTYAGQRNANRRNISAKLDCLIRQQQANRKESVKVSPILKLKKIFT